VIAARRRQAERLGVGRTNAGLTPAELRSTLELDHEARKLVRDGFESLRLSGRGHDRALRLARTIADLAASDRVEARHIGEALMLRSQEPRR